MNNPKHRRDFLRQMTLYTMAAGLLPSVLASCNSGSSVKTEKDSTAVTTAGSEDKPLFFKISLAEWSFHQAIFAKKLSHLDFPLKAKKDFGIEAVEYLVLKQWNM